MMTSPATAKDVLGTNILRAETIILGTSADKLYGDMNNQNMAFLKQIQVDILSVQRRRGFAIQLLLEIISE